MSEDFLYHVWKFRLFNHHDLKTTDGHALEIIKTGERNNDSGPDFFNARAKINGTEWAGNIEIDVTTAEWFLHRHNTNKAFSGLILHVVYEVTKEPDHNFPVLELKNYISNDLLDNFRMLDQSSEEIPCRNRLADIPTITMSNWLERMLIERAEEKSLLIEEELFTHKMDWEQAFYHALARNFGFKVNALPFDILAGNIHLSVLAKQKNDLHQLEAILFGVAGFLEDNTADDYYQSLKKEYAFLSGKFTLRSMEKSIWKFARLHPVNFPTVRIAQFAKLIHQSSHLFSKIIETSDLGELKKLFHVEPSAYWTHHFHFDKKTTSQPKTLGTSSIENILINTVVPFLFVYGKVKNNSIFRERALSLLEVIKPENNRVVRRWKDTGMEIKNAWQTQGLLQLTNNYCTQKQCLRCAIGLKIIRSNEQTR